MLYPIITSLKFLRSEVTVNPPYFVKSRKIATRNIDYEL